MPTDGNAISLRILPMFAVEKSGRLQCRPVDAVQTPGIDGNLVGLGTRYVKRVHPADGAEWMLRHPGFEMINRQGGFAPQQLKVSGKDRQM